MPVGESRGGGFGRFALRALVAVIFAGMLAVFAIALVPSLHELRSLRGRTQKLEDENRNIEDATRHLKEKQEQLLHDPQAVEMEARARGMARAGETIFRPADATNTRTPQPPPAPAPPARKP
jgi:cell division protein FtsB